MVYIGGSLFLVQPTSFFGYFRCGLSNGLTKKWTLISIFGLVRKLIFSLICFLNSVLVGSPAYLVQPPTVHGPTQNARSVLKIKIFWTKPHMHQMELLIFIRVIFRAFGFGHVQWTSDLTVGGNGSRNLQETPRQRATQGLTPHSQGHFW